MTKFSLHLNVFWAVLAAVVASPLSVSAHNVGRSFEQEVGNYFIDIGSSELSIRAGEPAAFDFDILAKDSKEPAPFASVWVRVEDGRKLLFAGGIAKASIGKTVMTYSFPHKGAFTLSVRFQSEGGSLAEASFPLTVEQPLSASGTQKFSFSRDLIGGGLAGLIVGFAASFMFRKRTAV